MTPSADVAAVESVVSWGNEAPSLRWPMANHTEARNAVARLLTSATESRLLLIRGPSESGKSHMSRQMLANGLLLPGLTCGRFDFKGTTNLDVELDAFVRSLRIDMPVAGLLTERLHAIFESLTRRAGPTLLVFDTYEAAGDAGEWVEQVLLQEAVRTGWLRIVIVGQRVPSRNGATWESIAAPTVTLQPLGPRDWFEYGRQHHSDKKITMELVTQVHQLVDGNAVLLAGVFGPG